MVIIVSILVAMAIPAYQKITVKSRLPEVCQAVSAIVQAKEAYYLTYGTYVSPLTDGECQVGYTLTPQTIEDELNVDIQSDLFNYIVRPNSTYPGQKRILVRPMGPDNICNGWIWTYHYDTKTWSIRSTLPCVYSQVFPAFPLDCTP